MPLHVGHDCLRFGFADHCARLEIYLLTYWQMLQRCLNRSGCHLGYWLRVERTTCKVRTWIHTREKPLSVNDSRACPHLSGQYSQRYSLRGSSDAAYGISPHYAIPRHVFRFCDMPCVLVLHETCKTGDWLTDLWFYIPIDTKQVILETFLRANLLAWYGKNQN